MFKNTKDNRKLLRQKGFTAPPSIETDPLKIRISIGETIDAWNEEQGFEGPLLVENASEFNDALRDNDLRRRKS